MPRENSAPMLRHVPGQPVPDVPQGANEGQARRRFSGRTHRSRAVFEAHRCPSRHFARHRNEGPQAVSDELQLSSCFALIQLIVDQKEPANPGGCRLKPILVDGSGINAACQGTGSSLAEPVPGNFRAREPECDGPFPNPRFGLPGPYTDRRSICAQRFEERSSRLHFVTHTCHRPGIHACSVCFGG